MLQQGLGFFEQAGASRRNREAAERDQQLQFAQLALRMQQERTQEATKIYFMDKEADQVISTAENRAGEMGVTGNTLQALIGTTQADEDLREAIVKENTNWSIQQGFMQAAGISAQTQSRINSVPEPSFANLLLGAAKTGLSAYNTHKEVARRKGVDNSEMDRLDL